jgi:hypothetical protein
LCSLPLFQYCRIATTIIAIRPKTASATLTPIATSAPVEREPGFDELAEMPVPVNNAELLVVTGLRLSEPGAELEVVVAEDELFVIDDVVSEELGLVEDKEEPCTRLHLTVEDWSKLVGQIVNGGQHASDTPCASIAICCQ